MRDRIPDVIRSRILQLWLAGENRDDIGRQTRVSAGTVSNVISDFKYDLANYDIGALRELGVAMKNAKVTPQQCADATRTLSILAKGNVSADDLDLFVNNVYKGCQNNGLPEERLVDLSSQLFSISSSLDIPVYDLPARVEELKKKRDALQNEVEELQNNRDAAKNLLEEELRSKDVTLADLEQFVTAREAMKEQIGVSFSVIEDLPKLSNMFRNARQLQYNASKIAAKLSKIESLQERESTVRASIDKEEKHKNHLVAENKKLENKINSHMQTAKFHDELKEMGFGLKELRLLHATVQELVNTYLERTIGGIDEAPGKAAVKKFFRDLQEMYAQHLSYEEKIGQFERKVEQQEYLLERTEKRYADKKALADTISTLTNTRGFNYDDIVYLEDIILKHNISRADKEKFAKDLDQYGNVEAAIAYACIRLDELKSKEKSHEIRAQQLKIDIDQLIVKKNTVGESLDFDVKLVQASFAAAQMELESGIKKLTNDSKESIEFSKQLIEISKRTATDSAAMVANLKIEISKQYKSLLNLEGFKDLAELINKINSARDEDINKLVVNDKIVDPLIMHTVRILKLIISVYSRLGPSGAEVVGPLEVVSQVLVTHLATSAAEAFRKNTANTGAATSAQEQRDSGTATAAGN